uniref:Uncharacterized protein n=1 Tax=Astopletus virus TaxID=2800905 RepID=A0A894KMH4_9VIRU|nr:MAG: hypothetical protein 2 [Astopletus virus]
MHTMKNLLLFTLVHLANVMLSVTTTTMRECLQPRGDCRVTDDIITIESGALSMTIDKDHPFLDCETLLKQYDSEEGLFCSKGMRFIDCADCFHPRFIRQLNKKNHQNAHLAAGQRQRKPMELQLPIDLLLSVAVALISLTLAAKQNVMEKLQIALAVAAGVISCVSATTSIVAMINHT